MPDCPGPTPGLAEARKVQRHHPIAGRRKRLQMLVPHPPIGDPLVQQEHRGSFARFGVWELHSEMSRISCSVRSA
jgi:hypothetical protein